jgi:hypothetical protein
LSEAEVKNILVAHHIIHLFKGKVKIPDSIINTGQYTDEQARYIEAARIDLFESGKYGKVKIDTDKLYIEDMEENMFSFLRRNKNTKFICIDYAGIAQSKPKEKFAKHLDKYEIIEKLYEKAKFIAKEAGVAFLILNQFTREGEAASEVGKTILASHIQGGMVTGRYADYSIVATATLEQRQSNMIMMSTEKVRAASGFRNVPYNLDLSISRFSQYQTTAAS